MAQLTYNMLKDGLVIHVRGDVNPDFIPYIGEAGTKHVVMLRGADYYVPNFKRGSWWLGPGYRASFDVKDVPSALLLT